MDYFWICYEEYLQEDSARFDEKCWRTQHICEIDVDTVLYEVNDQQPQIWPGTKEVKPSCIGFIEKPDYELFQKIANVKAYLNEWLAKLHKKV